MKAHEICLGAVILTLHVQNHKVIIAAELRMADGWQKEMGHIKKTLRSYLHPTSLKRCIFRNRTRFRGLYVTSKS